MTWPRWSKVHLASRRGRRQFLDAPCAMALCHWCRWGWWGDQHWVWGLEGPMMLAFPNEYVQAIQPLSLGLEMERLDNEWCDLIYHSHAVARMFPKSHLIHLTTRHTKCCLNRILGCHTYHKDKMHKVLGVPRIRICKCTYWFPFTVN